MRCPVVASAAVDLWFVIAAERQRRPGAVAEFHSGVHGESGLHAEPSPARWHGRGSRDFAAAAICSQSADHVSSLDTVGATFCVARKWQSP